MINYRNKHYNKDSMAYMLKSGVPKIIDKSTRNTTPATGNSKQRSLNVWNKRINFLLHQKK